MTKLKNGQFGYGERLVLKHHWWSWNHPSIHQAIALGMVEWYAPLIHEALKANRLADRRPRTVEELAGHDLLRRNAVHTGRVLSGGNVATLQFLLGVATGLKASLPRLVPLEPVLIASATVHLSERTVSPEDARLYAAYRQALSSHDGSCPCNSALQSVAETQQSLKNSQLVLDRIAKVAQTLGPILVKIDHDLVAKNGG